MKMVHEMLKVIFMGGSHRGINLLRAMSRRQDIEIGLAVFINGYEDEREYLKVLISIAEDQGIPYVVTDVMTDDIIAKLKDFAPDVIIGGGSGVRFCLNPFLRLRLGDI